MSCRKIILVWDILSIPQNIGCLDWSHIRNWTETGWLQDFDIETAQSQSSSDANLALVISSFQWFWKS